MNIFQNTNFKISNLRLAVLIKVVVIKKECIQNFVNITFDFGGGFSDRGGVGEYLF